MYKTTSSMIWRGLGLSALALTAMFLNSTSAMADATTTTTTTTTDKAVVTTDTSSCSPSLLSQWWNGTSATGNWFGLRDTLADYGLTMKGQVKEIYFGQVSGGFPNSGWPSSNWETEVKLDFAYDFSKVFGIQGLMAYSQWRYRKGSDANEVAGGNLGQMNNFGPDHYQSGVGFRVLPQYLEYKSPNETITVSAGWENPYYQFLDQPMSKFFENNQIESQKGIGASGYGAGYYAPPAKGVSYPNNAGAPYYSTQNIPWSSSYASWGGMLKIKPTSTTYIMSGLYTAIAGFNSVSDSTYLPTSLYPYKTTSATSNSGLLGQNSGAFTANNNGTPLNGQSRNYNPGSSITGIYSVSELGWRPKFGKDKLEGHYAFGGIFWGQPTALYLSVPYNAAGVAGAPNAKNVNYTYAFYLQADQMLYRAPASDAAPTQVVYNGKDVAGKSVTAPAPVSHDLSKKGLYEFAMFTFSPQSEQEMPEYFQVGLVYQGLIPHRDNDKMGIAFGAGFFSPEYNSYLNNQNQYASLPADAKKGIIPKPFNTTESVLEAFYLIQINKWANVKPFVQFINNPVGNGLVQSDWILGSSITVGF